MTISIWQNSLLHVILKGQPDSSVSIAVFFNPCFITRVGFGRTGNFVSSNILPCSAQSNAHHDRPDAPVITASEFDNGIDSLLNDRVIRGGQHSVKRRVFEQQSVLGL